MSKMALVMKSLDNSSTLKLKVFTLGNAGHQLIREISVMRDTCDLCSIYFPKPLLYFYLKSILNQIPCSVPMYCCHSQNHP
jgi:hypothetical protein